MMKAPLRKAVMQDEIVSKGVGGGVFSVLEGMVMVILVGVLAVMPICFGVDCGSWCGGGEVGVRDGPLFSLNAKEETDFRYGDASSSFAPSDLRRPRMPLF